MPVLNRTTALCASMISSVITGLRLAIFTAEPCSRSEDALNLLASWAATPDSERASVRPPAARDARDA
jgi:hypothetical protein